MSEGLKVHNVDRVKRNSMLNRFLKQDYRGLDLETIFYIFNLGKDFIPVFDIEAKQKLNHLIKTKYEEVIFEYSKGDSELLEMTLKLFNEHYTKEELFLAKLTHDMVQRKFSLDDYIVRCNKYDRSKRRPNETYTWKGLIKTTHSSIISYLCSTVNN